MASWGEMFGGWKYFEAGVREIYRGNMTVWIPKNLDHLTVLFYFWLFVASAIDRYDQSEKTAI